MTNTYYLRLYTDKRLLRLADENKGTGETRKWAETHGLASTYRTRTDRDGNNCIEKITLLEPLYDELRSNTLVAHPFRTDGQTLEDLSYWNLGGDSEDVDGYRLPIQIWHFDYIFNNFNATDDRSGWKFFIGHTKHCLQNEKLMAAVPQDIAKALLRIDELIREGKLDTGSQDGQIYGKLIERCVSVRVIVHCDGRIEYRYVGDEHFGDIARILNQMIAYVEENN